MPKSLPDAATSLADASGRAPELDAGHVETCDRPSVAVCNPVDNTGCPDSMQCDVDLIQAELAGRCTFSAPFDDGGVPCLATPFTQSCNPGSTCGEDGSCQRICFCDADCDKTECCHGTIGDLGFKLCGSC